MTSPTLRAVDDLIALRRRQMAVVVDALQAALDLAEVVQTASAGHSFETVPQFLAVASDEVTRGIWQSYLDRATQPLPNGDPS